MSETEQLATLVAVLTARVEALEAWRREMAEQVLTEKLVAKNVEVGYSVSVGDHRTGASVHMWAQQEEGYAAVAGYHDTGSDFGFCLDASDPDHECRGPAGETFAYGSLTIYSPDGEAVIGDDIRTAHGSRLS
jgi:hypothetical protein